MRNNHYYVYMLASKRNGTLYIGVTGNIHSRISIHKDDVLDGFTQKYQVHKLVYCEIFTNIQEAIAREKQLKKWNRGWKIELIEKGNPNWSDISALL